MNARIRIRLCPLAATLGLLLADAPSAGAQVVEARLVSKRDFRRAGCPNWLGSSELGPSTAMPLRCVSLRIPQAVWLVVSHPPTGSLADGGVPLLRQVFDRLSHARLSRVPSVDEEFSSSASYELKVVDMDGNGVDEVLETILSGHGGWYSHASTLLAFDELGTMRSIPIPVQGVLHTAERYNGNTGRSEILCEGGVTLEPASKGNQPHLRVYSAIVIPGEDTQECAPPQDEALWLKGSTLVATPQKRDRKARGRTRPKR